MPKGDLEIRITDMRGEPIRAKVEIELQRLPGDAGAGGESSEVVVNMASSAELHITGIACRGGPGTLYKVVADTSHYRTYSFFQSIRESMVNPPSDDIEFWVKPGDVKGIRGPKFSDLSTKGQSILAGARMVGEEKEDEDLVGLQGASLYSRLGSLRQACLLNILKKADHFSSARCLKDLQELLVCRQDRFFAFVRPQLPARLAGSPKFKSAPGTLHKPLKGFRMSSNGSFKSRDPHANLQVTFLEEIATGRLAADIDIDESSGIEHGFEVVRNAVFKKRTNPYLVREFLLSADLQEHSLDPGYKFVF